MVARHHLLHPPRRHGYFTILDCAVSLAVRRIPPTLRSLELKRSGTSSGVPPPHLQALLTECALEDVWRLKCAEGLIPVSSRSSISASGCQPRPADIPLHGSRTSEAGREHRNGASGGDGLWKQTKPAYKKAAHTTRSNLCLQVWDTALFPRWQSLTSLVLTGCNLAVLPAMVGRLTNLRDLHVAGNRLAQVCNLVVFVLCS